MATAELLTTLPADTRDPQVVEKEYDSTVRADIELFRSQAQSFLDGQITDDQLRPHRLRRGVYSQRQSGVQMIRTKVPGGQLTADQISAIAAYIWSISHGTAPQ